MEDKTPSSEEPTVPPTPKSGKGKLLKVVLILAVAGLLGASGYLYNDKNSKNSQLEAEVAQLKLSLAEVGSGPEVADPADEVAESVACSAGSNYTAEIGKFTATLDSPYVIIRNLDAGFEGGPITSLNVASCLASENNVYDSPPTEEVSILAHPASTSTELRTAYEGSSGSLTADGTVMIAGVTADKYVLSGLFETTLIYFDNASIGYQIELSDTNATTSAILTDLTADWVFTP